ncbi:hypothetical protein ABI59_00650 [Acidobacteria bacterium Mor1]|nr:hypothetical protein ABI59_00650 [Acidobacteria bacterium Mor1]
MSRIKIAIALAAVIGAGAYVALRSSDDSAGGRTARVERGELVTRVQATGTLEAEVAYEIGPPSIQGFWEYNLSWMIPEGSYVKEGDVVARFDATEIEDRLRNHRAALETTEQEKEKEKRNLDVDLRQLRLDLTKAEGELKTVNLDLSLPEGMVSDIEVERNRLQERLASRRVDFLSEKIAFESDLVDSKLELLDVKRNYEQTKIDYNETAKSKFSIRAPVSGLVVYMPKQGGDRWEIGEGVWMLAKILKIADVSTLRVEASVLEVDAARVDVGQAAEIRVDAVPGMRLESQVEEIGRIVRERSAQDRSKVFDVFMPLDEVDGDVLRPGMGVQVEVRTASLPDRLTIPLEAVRSSDEGTWVWVQRGGGRERRAVELGPRNDRRVVVVEGLEEGEKVLLEASDRA